MEGLQKCKHGASHKKQAASTPNHKRTSKKRKTMIKKNMDGILSTSNTAWPTMWQRIMKLLGFGPNAQQRSNADEHAQDGVAV